MGRVSGISWHVAPRGIVAGLLVHCFLVGKLTMSVETMRGVILGLAEACNVRRCVANWTSGRLHHKGLSMRVCVLQFA